MEPGKSDAEAAPKSPGMPGKRKLQFHFAELPDGIIRFTAQPKRFRKKNERDLRILPVGRITKVDVDDISDQLEKKLGFTKKGERKILFTKHAPKKKNKSVVLFKGVTECKFMVERGFWRKAFTPTFITEFDREEAKLQNISAMEFYQGKSMEELRYEDYLSGRKGRVSFSHCGPDYKPVTGDDWTTRFGTATSINTHYQVISASTEFEKHSLEEIRLEYYMPISAWKDRKTYGLSYSEMCRLPVTIGSEVFVFMDNHSDKKKGTIKYIGRLPDTKKAKDTIYAGVEFTESCGCNDGSYGGCKFFRTKKNHGEFVPIDAVIPCYLINECQPQAMESNNEGQGQQQCSVCWANPIAIFFLPCGHVCCCDGCSKKVKDCPVCRKKIDRKYKAFLSGK